MRITCNIEASELIEAIVQDLDPSDIAACFETSDIADEISASIEASDVAEHIDLADLASYLDHGEIASRVELPSLDDVNERIGAVGARIDTLVQRQQMAWEQADYFRQHIRAIDERLDEAHSRIGRLRFVLFVQSILFLTASLLLLFR